MAKSWIPFFSVISIAVVLVVACVVIALQKDRSSTEGAAETERFSRGPVKTTEDLTLVTVNSSKRAEARNSTNKQHQEKFCTKCCQTPPCWYNNHKECSKCANQKNLKHVVARLLRRSHKKAVHNPRRNKQRPEKHKT